MHWADTLNLKRLRAKLAAVLAGPPALAFLPAISLAAFWLGGEAALLAVSAILPLTYVLAGGFGGAIGGVHISKDAIDGLFSRSAFEDVCDQKYEITSEKAWQSATYFLEIDDDVQIVDRYGQLAADTVIKRTAERLITMLRDEDSVGKMGDARFAICVAPVRHMDLELCIQMAGRLQTALEEPLSIDGTTIYVSGSVGFCQHSRSPKKNGAAWLQAAATALREAQRHGPAAIRAFSDQMRRETQCRAELRDEVGLALDAGHIQPWFQPQISTDTGQITGFEALARWSHPNRGMIAPQEFLPAIESAGMLERLAEKMMYHSFAALKAWDVAGLEIHQVGVNFSGSELSNPRLLEKIKWELDRFDLTPDRLAVEVLETVVASSPDDVITRNINALGELGCRIDLDDFGTGHASIASIRRFAVSRIKIDRSFIIKADRDSEQQRMISAILTMAERLEVETLAEGVESVGEHVLLAQLGCDHVQGFGIGKPMPFEQTLDWIAGHNSKLADVPRIMQGKQK
ncbi:diguanylate cyclase [Sulfitobacter sp. SK012]|uniref:putative bifunctional diguanylate cyclase/phosphodiesterase n=1 Tax=Sulfitobacter sp. SK012 TaxID=1389005 RepID=UPI000E0C8F83|nr:GGDEF domain-containing phosphodiesterase [Sulfitobacter sp. SK012]AXI45182.1 diguanylate cyclase [Sulfitobacter sp. SK012]